MICKTCNNKGFIIQDGKAFKCTECYKRISKFQKDIKFDAVLKKFKSCYYEEDIFTFMQNYIETFSFDSPSLYLQGINSSGKSTLAKWVLFQIEQRYRLRVEKVLFSELVRKLTEWDISLAERYRECDLLLVDDCFDTEKSAMYASKYQLSFIDEFFRRRLEFDYKPTILTSNTNFIEKSEQFIKDYNTSLYFLLERNVKCFSFTRDIKRNLDKSIEEKIKKEKNT